MLTGVKTHAKSTTIVVMMLLMLISSTNSAFVVTPTVPAAFKT
jgi:hypothetical protein